MSEEREEAYSTGQRQAWLFILQLCLQHLEQDDWSQIAPANWIQEREVTIQTLRHLCAKHGDNDWPSKLHLSDIIEKHLVNYFETA